MPHRPRASTTLLCLVLLLSLTSCRRAQRLALPDVTKLTHLTLSKETGQGYIHALRLDVKGEIDGSATLKLVHPGEPVPRTFTVSGTVSEEMFSSDWYADKVELEYVPSGVTRGHLRFVYCFED